MADADYEKTGYTPTYKKKRSKGRYKRRGGTGTSLFHQGAGIEEGSSNSGSTKKKKPPGKPLPKKGRGR